MLIRVSRPRRRGPMNPIGPTMKIFLDTAGIDEIRSGSDQYAVMADGCGRRPRFLLGRLGQAIGAYCRRSTAGATCEQDRWPRQAAER